MQDIQIFNFDTETPIRTREDEDGEGIICASDLAKAMGIRNAADRYASIPAKHKVIVSTDTPGGAQEMLYLREPGAYMLVMQTRLRKSNAYYERIVAFQVWVCEDVIPSIRKTGKYEIPSNIPPATVVDVTPEPAIDFAFLAPQAEHALRIAKSFFFLDGTDAAVRANQLMKKFHKVDLLEAAGMKSLPSQVQESNLNVTEVGKLIGLNARQVNTLLCDHGFQTKVEHGEPPYQPTPKGKPFAHMVSWDLSKEDGSNMNVKPQLRWYTSVVPVLKALLTPSA